MDVFISWCSGLACIRKSWFCLLLKAYCLHRIHWYLSTVTLGILPGYRWIPPRLCESTCYWVRQLPEFFVGSRLESFTAVSGMLTVPVAITACPSFKAKTCACTSCSAGHIKTAARNDPTPVCFNDAERWCEMRVTYYAYTTRSIINHLHLILIGCHWNGAKRFFLQSQREYSYIPALWYP